MDSTMSKCRLIIFSGFNDLALGISQYFESRDYIVKVKTLELEWSKDYVREVCRKEIPNAIIVWDMYDSVTSPVLSVYHDLKANPLTVDIAVVLILAAWPKDSVNYFL